LRTATSSIVTATVPSSVRFHFSTRFRLGQVKAMLFSNFKSPP
jgi:hypothetical protein